MLPGMGGRGGVGPGGKGGMAVPVDHLLAVKEVTPCCERSKF